MKQNVSVCPQLGWPDMRLPILYTMSWPERVPCSEATWPRLDFVKMGDLTFRNPDRAKYPAMDLAFAAGRAGGTMTGVLSAANEQVSLLPQLWASHHCWHACFGMMLFQYALGLLVGGQLGSLYRGCASFPVDPVAIHCQATMCIGSALGPASLMCYAAGRLDSFIKSAMFCMSALSGQKNTFH